MNKNRLCIPNAGAPGLISGLRSHMPHSANYKKKKKLGNCTKEYEFVSSRKEDSKDNVHMEICMSSLGIMSKHNFYLGTTQSILEIWKLRPAVDSTGQKPKLKFIRPKNQNGME